MAMARVCDSAMGARISSCRTSSPGGDPAAEVFDGWLRRLLRQALPDFRPAKVGPPQDVGGVGGKGGAGFLAAEQIEPLSGDQPEIRIAGYRDAPRHIDRIIAAELRSVDFRMGNERSAIAFIVETPDDAGLESLEFLRAEHGLAIGEIGDRVKPLDGKTGESIQDHPFGDRSVHCKRQAGQYEQDCQSGDQGISGAPTFSFLPWYRHS